MVYRIAIVLVSVVMVLASCRKSASEARIASNGSTESLRLKDLNTTFVVPGFEGYLNEESILASQDGTPEYVQYHLGQCFPASEFFMSMEQQLAREGWSGSPWSVIPTEPAAVANEWQPAGEPGILVRKQVWIREGRVLEVQGVAEALSSQQVRSVLVAFKLNDLRVSESLLAEINELSNDSVTPEGNASK